MEGAKQAVIDTVRKNHVSILIGETGSGKTTKLPQYLLDAGLLKELNSGYCSEQKVEYGTATNMYLRRRNKICVTQPRRIAAKTVSSFVASERQTSDEIGYAVRFEDSCTPLTRIKYVTDGILLRELFVDPYLNDYGIIVLDEAHERTLNGDILFALLKALLRQHRKNSLRIIIMSATMDPTFFQNYWSRPGAGETDNPRIKVQAAYIQGRQHTVSLNYLISPVKDYVKTSVNTVMQLLIDNAKSVYDASRSSKSDTSTLAKDILVFLPGSHDIESAYHLLLEKREKIIPQIRQMMDFLPLRLYSVLTQEEQMRIFEPLPTPLTRKVVLATNIAETSITIPGVKYVVDAGYVKEKRYDPISKVDTLHTVPVSQAQARQRAGRAGREGPGVCFRLYTEDHFHSQLRPYPLPEIQRTSVIHVVLQLKAMDVPNLLLFDFLDAPPRDAIMRATETLTLLGALDHEGRVTETGKRMARIPLDPKASRCVVYAEQMHCPATLKAVITILAMLSVESLLIQERRGDTNRGLPKSMKSSTFRTSKDDTGSRNTFESAASVHGDHFLYLEIAKEFDKQRVSERSSWCRRHGIKTREMLKAMDIRAQLLREIYPTQTTFGLHSESIDSDTLRHNVRISLCSGYFSHAVKWDNQTRRYVTLDTQKTVTLHPNSVLFASGKYRAEYLIYHSLVSTARVYMHNLFVIPESILKEFRKQ